MYKNALSCNISQLTMDLMHYKPGPNVLGQPIDPWIDQVHRVQAMDQEDPQLLWDCYCYILSWFDYQWVFGFIEYLSKGIFWILGKSEFSK